jgi:hypothetical protein
MFNFFKKIEKPKNLGTFSAYGMEDLFYYLSESRVQEKLRYLKDEPTLGTPFESFVKKEHIKNPSGELHFLVWLLWYFPDELDLALHLYNKSKEFSDIDYPKKDSLKSIWKNHLNKMDSMIEENPENKKYYISEKRPIFWIEFDMLYHEIIKNLIFNFNQQKFSNHKIVGEFKRKGSKITAPEMEIIYRSKSKPKVGYYLTFKSDSLFMDIKIDLNELKQDLYKFDTLFGAYRLELNKDSAKISEYESFSNDKNILIKSTDFKDIIQELTSNYLINFDKISERYIDEIRKPAFNFFLFIVLQIKELDQDLRSKIESELISKIEIWSDLKQYYGSSIMGYPLKSIKIHDS